MSDSSPNLTPASKRQWVRLSLLGSFAAGMLLACWVGYHLNWIRQRHNAKVIFGIGQIAIIQPDGTTKLEFQTWGAPWPLGWFGEKGQHLLMVEDSTPKEEIDRILALFPEANGKIDVVAREDIDPSIRR